jgi:hypothetical protein
MKTKLKELRDEAQELIDLGDSHEKREGYGMLKVIDALTDTEDYFKIQSNGYNEELQREEIQIHAGQNGNIFLIKTEEGFIVDVYGQEEIVNSMPVWEDDLMSDEDTDTNEEKKWLRMADDSNDGDLDLDDDGNCKYCGQKCFDGQMCDEQQAGGFNNTEPTAEELEAFREQYINKLMSTKYKDDDPKYDDSTRNYLRGMSTEVLLQMIEDSGT